jgi:hypothetical protein
MSMRFETRQSPTTGEWMGLVFSDSGRSWANPCFDTQRDAADWCRLIMHQHDDEDEDKYNTEYDEEAEEMARWGTKGKPGCFRNAAGIALIGIGWALFAFAMVVS